MSTRRVASWPTPFSPGPRVRHNGAMPSDTAEDGRADPIRAEKSISYVTKSGFAEQAIREAILAGRLGPDQPVRQDELARSLGMSATPVREAIRRLEAEGLLRHEPHKGVTVAVPSPTDVVELYWIRSGLESVTVWLAMSRGTPASLAALADRLQRVQRQVAAAVASGDLRRVPRLNRDFHFAIYEAANSPRLLEMIRRYWGQIPHYYLWMIPGRAEHNIALHEPIIDAIRRRDADAAEAMMRRHIRHGAETLLETLEQAPPAPRAGARGRH